MTAPTRAGRAAAASPDRTAPATALPPQHSTRRPHSRAVFAARLAFAVRRCSLLVPAALLAVLVLAAAGCGSSTGLTAGAGEQPRELSVLAAASLTDVFTQLGEDFMTAHPDVRVAFDFAASNDLVSHLEQGAPGDVLATADTQTMHAAGDLVDEPQAFAGNKLAIAVAPGNPEHVTGLTDLHLKDLKVVVAAPEVPAGKYALEAARKAGVTLTPVSLEVSVKGVVAKVSLEEADAGIVFATDVRAAKGGIDGVLIPDDQNVIATYPLATVAASERPEDARAFVDFVLSAEGQEVLAGYGFLPAP